MALSPTGSRGKDPSANVDSVFGRTGVVVAANGDYTAAQVSALAATAVAGGDLTGNYPNPTLAAAGGGAAGPIGDSTHVAAVTVDAKGRVTALSSVAIAAGGSLPYSARSSNTILAAGDKSSAIAATAAYTQTFTAAATLGAGWWCVIQNATTAGTAVLTLDPNGAETIDGLTTAAMYSGETRLVECDGANFFTQMLHGGYAKFTPTGGNFIVPAGVEQADVVCIGSGGQGGGGASAVSTAKSGGGGGGGGAVSRVALRGSDLGAAGATITVTVAAGGSAGGGGGGAGAGAPGSDGSDGGATTFGTLLKAGGGGGGKGATNASIQGGAGGSVINSATTITAGAPSATSTAIGGQAANSSTAGANAGGPTEWGGASGGSAATNGKAAGGGSIYGGPGGASGGQVAVGNTGTAGAAGGTTQNYTSGSGGSAGNGGASTTKGGDGAFTGPFCGQGGGGGGSGNADVAGKDGGAGSIGAGGGGGGSSSSASSSPAGGIGGAGGAGECRVWYS